MVLRPAFAPDDITREQSVILEEIKMVEDVPDDLVHEVFSQQFWQKHPLGRPILGTPDTVTSFEAGMLRDYFQNTYVAPNLIVSAAGHLDHAGLRRLVERAFESAPTRPRAAATAPPAVTPGLATRQKEIEQSHLVLGTPAYHQSHEKRHAMYVMNTILGGSMSSRLFQHIREERGLAYSVFSTLTAYSDAGMATVYAGCATDKVGEVADLTITELRELRARLVPEEELRRAKDHLKGSLMLSLENTSSRMTHLARQEIYFGRQFTLDEILAGIESVSAEDVRRVANDLFQDGQVVATLVGPDTTSALKLEQLRV